MELKDFLGEKSYPSIVHKIIERIKSAEADSKAGNKLISELYTKLNESATPMLCVKDFILNSGSIKDSALQDVVEFCKEKAQSSDFNYIINVCKEEHLNNLDKLGIINPTETIKSQLSMFELPSDDVKKMIIRGKFDNLNSPLLFKIKKSMGLPVAKKPEEKTEVKVVTTNFDDFDYESIKSKLFTYIFGLKSSETVQGTNYINMLNESIKHVDTPILTVVDTLKTINNYLKVNEDKSLHTVMINIYQLLDKPSSVNYKINIAREDCIKNNLDKIDEKYYEIILEDDDTILNEISEGNYNWLSKSKYFKKLVDEYDIYLDVFNEKTINTYLGDKCYSSVIEQIKNKISEGNPNTLIGTELVNELHKKLNESDNITPMLTIKEFITNAQSIAPDDTKLSDIINFCKKKATTGDLNYIINMCKEEHLENMKRAGHPDPEKTISEIKNYFNQPASVIEKAIHDGIFDCLNSKLLNDVKKSLKIEIVEQPEDGHKLNEGFDGYCEYSPIGVLCEIPNEGVCILCESDILSYNKEHEEFKKLDESLITQVPQRHKRLMTAINEASYNPNKMEFTLNEEWDFNLVLNKEGKCFVGLNEDNMKEIDSKNLRKLLLESIHSYQAKGGVSFNKELYLHDADNIVCLMENHNNIACIDNIKVIRNLNENKYVMIDSNDVFGTNVPKILSINGNQGKTYKSFTELNESIKQTIGFDCVNLFESEIISENQHLEEKREKLTALMEQQKEINKQIQNVENLKKLADEDSPAMDKLNEQHNILNQALKKNFDDISFYQNELELH